jgi:hypothetical protein
MATFREIGNDPIIIDAILADNPHFGTKRSIAIRLALHEWWDRNRAAQPQRPEAQAQEPRQEGSDD